MLKEKGEFSGRAIQPLFAAFALGFSSLLAQLVSLREFIATFQGNELTLGIFLASSLLLTASGTWLGGLPSLRGRFGLATLLVASAPMPVAQIATIRLLRGWVGAGLTPSLEAVFGCALLTLIPGCLTFGLLFTRASSLSNSDSAPAKVYMTETAGAVFGGLLYTVATAACTPVFLLACAPAMINAVVATLIFWVNGARGKSAAVAACAGVFLAIIASTDLTTITLAGSFPGQEIVKEVNSPYGDLLLTRSRDQLTLFENGLPLSSTQDSRAAEQIVHYTMAQRPQAKAVLLFGGTASGAIAEVLKYPVSLVTDVETDLAVVELAKLVTPETRDPRLRLLVDDPRHYARLSADHYDVIILAEPDPSTAALNRLYTVEFFRDLRSILNAQGVLGFTIAGSENYRGHESRRLNQALFTSLSSVFPNVLVLPAGRFTFLGSAAELHSNVSEVIEAYGIKTSYVNRAHLLATLTVERVDRLRNELRQPGQINRDLEPSVYRLYLGRWLAELGGSALWLAAALLLVGILSLRGSLVGGGAPVRLAVLSSGFASLTLEFCLLLAFQMIHGSLFSQMGLMVAAFMFGNTLGAVAGLSKAPKQSVTGALVLLECLTALLACSVAGRLALSYTSFSLSPPDPLTFSLALGLVGFLTGAQFPLALRALRSQLPQPAAKIYAADLTGAALGAATAGVFLVPLLGVLNLCLVVAATKAISCGFLLLSRQTEGREPVRPDPTPARLVALSLLATASFLIIAPRSEMAVYSSSFSGSYHLILFIILLAGLLLTINLRPQRWEGIADTSGKTTTLRLRLRRLAISKPAHIINLTTFSLATFYPLARCYFQVPYLFCHVCPRVCVFGYLRPFWVPAAFLMNLGSYSWCQRMCPLGAAFQPARGKQLKRRQWRLVHGLRLGALAFLVYSYFAISAGAADESPVSTNLYSVLFKNAYSVSLIVLAVTAGLLVVNRWIPRSFCNLLCPVGASCDLAHDLLRHIPAGKLEVEKLAEEKDEGY